MPTSTVLVIALLLALACVLYFLSKSKPPLTIQLALWSIRQLPLTLNNEKTTWARSLVPPGSPVFVAMLTSEELVVTYSSNDYPYRLIAEKLLLARQGLSNTGAIELSYISGKLVGCSARERSLPKPTPREERVACDILDLVRFKL